MLKYNFINEILKQVQFPKIYRIQISLVIFAIGSIFNFAIAQEVTKYFEDNCAGCHTIGGGVLAGADLKDVSKRYERDWLIKFITDPEGLYENGDPLTVKLFDESGNFMPTMPDMTIEMAEQLLNLINTESQLKHSQFKGVEASEEGFSEIDILKGYNLFTGIDRFENGGDACIACHSTNNLSNLGGGRYAPSLTESLIKMNGNRAFMSWLNAPGTPVMRKLYSDAKFSESEIVALTAFIENSTDEKYKNNQAKSFQFIIMGMIGAIVLLIVLSIGMRNRLYGVRSQLVKSQSTERNQNVK